MIAFQVTIAIIQLNTFSMSLQDVSTIPGKLLLVVYQMYKDNQLDNRGKLLLKDMIISNTPSIIAAYQNYQKNGTQLTLRTTLFKLQAIQKQSEQQQGKSKCSRKSKNLNKITIPPRNIPKVPTFLRAI